MFAIRNQQATPPQRSAAEEAARQMSRALKHSRVEGVAIEVPAGNQLHLTGDFSCHEQQGAFDRLWRTARMVERQNPHVQLTGEFARPGGKIVVEKPK